jgi:hypothetical protein
MHAVPRPRRLLLALGVVAASLGLAGTASASVPGIERVEAETGSDSFSPKLTSVACPSNKQVVGVGAEITGGLGEVAITQLFPSNDLRRVNVEAEEDADGSSKQWSVTAYAMCANPIAGSHVVKNTRANVIDDASVVATCPAGEKVMSVGGFSGAPGVPGGRVSLTGLTYPSSSSGQVRAQERPPGTTATWSVDAFAICGPPLPGQVRGTNFSVSDSNAKQRGIGCPAGKNLLGGGAAVALGLGQVVLDDLRPSPTGFTAFGREDQDGFAGNWFLEANAICA